MLTNATNKNEMNVGTVIMDNDSTTVARARMEMKVPCKNAENAMKRFVPLLKQFSNVVLVVHKD